MQNNTQNRLFWVHRVPAAVAVGSAIVLLFLGVTLPVAEAAGVHDGVSLERLAESPSEEMSEALEKARRGEYARASEELSGIITEATRAGDHETEARARLARGEIAMIAEDRAGRGAAREDLETTARLAAKGGHPGLEALAWAALARLARLEGRDSQALEADRLAAARAESAGDPATSLRVRVNAARAAQRASRRPEARAESVAADRIVATFPDRADALDRLHLAETWAALSRDEPDRRLSAADRLHAFAHFRSVIQGTQSAANRSSVARAHLGLGLLYRDENRFDEAGRSIEAAALLAQAADATEILQTAEHELGRVLLRAGQPVAAEAAYHRSLSLLELLRPRTRRTFAFDSLSFREGRGSLYYELVALLLREAPAASTESASTQPSDSRLVRAREVVERLKAEEIRDYYGDACADLALGPVRSVDELSGRETLIVYPIVLDDRIELLVTRQGRIERFRVDVPRARVVERTRELRRALEDAPSRAYLRSAMQIYDWLVRPYEALLDASVTTVVFVPDAPFRTIPMAALHDGERFLIERLATATTPGISLVDPRPVDLSALKVLAAGVSDSVDGLPELRHVPAELEQLERHLGAKVLLDEAFTRATLEAEIEGVAWNVLHLATHAEFGEAGEESFLMTHDGRLGMAGFDELISSFSLREQPLELLTLSACETAAGSDRAALGLSGAAIQSGARSVLGTLWTVNDEATARLIDAFYSRLVLPGTTRAEAIRGAQRSLLEDETLGHPAYWSGFLLINNWM